MIHTCKAYGISILADHPPSHFTLSRHQHTGSAKPSTIGHLPAHTTYDTLFHWKLPTIMCFTTTTPLVVCEDGKLESLLERAFHESDACFIEATTTDLCGTPGNEPEFHDQLSPSLAEMTFKNSAASELQTQAQTSESGKCCIHLHCRSANRSQLPNVRQYAKTTKDAKNARLAWKIGDRRRES